MESKSARGDLIIIGAGGAGLEALWVARRQTGERGGSVGWNVLGFADDKPSLRGVGFDGAEVLGSSTELIARFRGRTVKFHCAIGNNRVRARIAALWEQAGFGAATLVDPTAVIAGSASIGLGCYIAPSAFIGPAARIGEHVLINVGASVGHHVQIGDFGQLSPGARLSGYTVAGAGVLFGSNAVTVPGIQVGEWATVAAASLAVRPVPAGGTALGVPAKILAAPTPIG